MLILATVTMADYLPYIINIFTLLALVLLGMTLKWVYQKHKASKPKPTWNK